MEAIIKRQHEIFEVLKQLKTNFSKDSESRKTPEYIRKRLETLKNLWAEFEHNNNLLLEYEQVKEEAYFRDNVYEKTRSMYMDIHQALQSYMQHTSDTKPKSDSNSLADILAKQRTNFRALKRLLNSIKLDSLSEKWEIEDEIRNLQAKWNAIDALHLDIDNITQGFNGEYEKEFSEHEVLFKDIKRKLNHKLSSTSHLQLSTPRIEIPIFSGSYIHWPTFFDLFSAAIHNNNMITKSQKMQHLKGKLKGEAERLIHHLHISEENYDTAWEILVHRYNNPQLIFTKHIEILLNQPSVQRQTASEIKRIHDTTAECIHSIHNLGVDTNSWDPLIVHLVSKKLDSQTFSEYKESRESPRELPTLSEFMTFIEGKFIALEPIHKKEREFPKPVQQLQPPIRRFYQNQQGHENAFRKNTVYSNLPNHLSQQKFGRNYYQSNAAYARKCSLCNLNHDLFQCDNFNSMTPDNKLATITKLKVCQNCLYHHFNNKCTSQKRCKNCNGEHNTKLHDAFAQAPIELSSSKSATKLASNSKSENAPQKQFNAHHVAQNDEEILLTTTLIQIKSNDGSYHTLRALLDQGSQISLLTERAAQLLQLPRNKYHASISGIGAEAKPSRGVVTLECKSIYNDYDLTTQAVVVSSLINNLPNVSFKRQPWQHLQHINLADPEYNLSKSVDLLLDASVYSEIIMNGLIKGPPHAPIAQQTRLGWILSGNIRTFNCNVIIKDLSELSRYWEVEEISNDVSQLSDEDQLCEDIYKSTTVRLENGRYQVNLPMKKDFENQLGSSKNKAFAQFKQLERKMSTKPEFALQYRGFMREYEELGHMRPASPTNETSYFLPHHGVEKPDSTTTRLRVVFNASSKTSSGKSLNDLMLSGTNLQQDLQTLILKWRQFNYVITADIEKAFRNLFINQSQHNLQRVLWRAPSNSPIQEYCLTTVTYGTKAAPFLTMRTLKQLASDDGEKYPLAAQELRNSFYMDDLISGHNDKTSAKLLVTQLIEILKGAGMNLRKWSSNQSDILSDLSEEQLNSTYEFKCKETRKTLGLQWNPTDDAFTYHNKLNQHLTTKQTKRQILSEISQIFDPLGWLSPLTIRAKLFFQNLWSQVLSWDEEVSDSLQSEWHKIRSDLLNIDQFQIPRQVGNTESTITLHGFSDASEKAYACCVYFVTVTPKGAHTSRLVAAKTKLAPLNKMMTLPRLELCGALLLAQLMSKIIRTLSSENISIHAWSDSMIVLGWIHGDQSRWKQFVSNRVQKIKDLINITQWNYIKSEDNPADCATRGVTFTQLLSHPLWWVGPEWLTTEKSDLIQTPSYQEPDIEIKKPNVTAALCHYQPDFIMEQLNKHSSITFIAKTIAWVLRFIARIRRRCDTSVGSTLSPNELRHSYQLIIKTVQSIEFEQDLENITSKGHVHKSSKLACLNPFIDENGILRVGGRLNNSIICWSKKHPIILNRHGRLTELITNQAHLTTLHGGPRLTLTYLRNTYWIISGMSTVKRVLRGCVKCRRFSQNKYQPIMADLPPARVMPSKPFTHCGVDFTGHVDVKLNKGRGVRTTKGYIAIFICLATKAIHLELVSDLSSPAFLAAFRRFCSRRGVPSHMYSDNGTNFVGADKLMKLEYQEIISNINNHFFDNIIELNIEWHFNAPAFPSAGGLWEAAVKSLKYHLKRVIGDQKLTYEEFITVLHQVEACLNSRPLFTLTENPDDEVLTPGHFLVGSSLLTRPQTLPESMTLTKRWQLVQSINKQFWKCWSSDYLHQLQLRSKWRSPDKNIQINDIVLIKEDNMPPGKWAMGRVLELHPGRDGHVRVVSLKTNNNILKRPVIKLVPLLSESSDHITESLASNTKTKRIRKQNPSKPNLFKNFFLSIFLFTLLLISPSIQREQNYDIKALDNSTSIYFDKISDIQYIRDEWNLVIYYNMSTYWQALHNIEKYIAHIKEGGSRKNSQYKSVTLQLEHELEEIEHYNQLLNIHRNRRRRRGLINGVGYIANSLFGVLDERFADQYQRDIERIQHNENHLQGLLHNQTIIIEAEYNILKRHEIIMKKQFSLIENHVNNLTLEVNHLRVDTSDAVYLISSSLAAHIIVSNIRRVQQTLINTLADINKGHISSHLISPDQLEEQVNIISRRLQGDLVLPTNENIINLYKLLRVSARITNQYLIMEIKVPILCSDTFELDRIINIPQRRNESFYHIVPIYPYIGFNINKDSVIFLSEVDLQTCHHFTKQKLICSIEKPIYTAKMNQSICNINLVSGGVKSPCKSEVSDCKEQWIKLHADNSWLFICCEKSTVRIICPSGISSQVLQGSGVIHLGPACTLKSNDFTIHSHNNFFNKLNIDQRFNVPEVSVLNKIMNTSKIDIIEPETHEKQWKLLNSQLNELKEQSNSELNVHDVHHYSLGYTILGLMVVGACVIGCVAVRRRCAAAPAAARPEPALRRVAQAGSASDVITNVPGVSNVPNEVRQSVLSVNTSGIQNVPSETRQSGLSGDKATSPMLNRTIKFEFPSDSE